VNRVVELEYAEYPPVEMWHSVKVPGASPSEIEAAIRRLDGERFPFLYLWPHPDRSSRDFRGVLYCFEVAGGPAGYWVAVTDEVRAGRQFDYPERGERGVAVVPGDESFVYPARHVCQDVGTVIRAACHYAEHGGCEPSLPWESPPEAEPGAAPDCQ
jgi:hypothetical protein